ncbi:hypothetical protein V1520DRAFT_280428 [Lipomyces starkeyi]|uniref:Uncharacterized protein n=1 Tax=Lipomyces starkeyi NRRL Y-11557 TaxID=675824 RepID=A0A1E3Q213_LIPST|nr:hypothetical protein LIPSTDRAFT_4961 [Lipomyces starkeyi NRRL Y-11557]
MLLDRVVKMHKMGREMDYRDNGPASPTILSAPSPRFLAVKFPLAISTIALLRLDSQLHKPLHGPLLSHIHINLAEHISLVEVRSPATAGSSSGDYPPAFTAKVKCDEVRAVRGNCSRLDLECAWRSPEATRKGSSGPKRVEDFFNYTKFMWSDSTTTPLSVAQALQPYPQQPYQDPIQANSERRSDGVLEAAASAVAAQQQQRPSTPRVKEFDIWDSVFGLLTLFNPPSGGSPEAVDMYSVPQNSVIQVMFTESEVAPRDTIVLNTRRVPIGGQWKQRLPSVMSPS